MSKAEPTKTGDRARNYVQASDRKHYTPRQWRRLRHKYNRAHGFYYGHWGDACKGHATPRRKRLVAP